MFADYALGQKPTWANVYTNNGYSPTAAKAEVASDYAMHTLFTDEATIREITKKHSKLALAIRNILARLKEMFSGKIGGKESELDTAIRLWNNAYNASIRSAKSDTKVNAAAQTKNTADDGVKWSVSMDNVQAQSVIDSFNIENNKVGDYTLKIFV